MFSQINRTRWALLVLIVLTVAVGERTWIGQSQVVGPTAPAPILTGKWKLDTGEIITITQDARRIVTAVFTPSVPCLNSTRTILFTGELKFTGTGDTATARIEGDRFWACTRTPAMVTECGVQAVFMTKFRADVTPFSITGEVLRPHYDYEIVNGRRTNCRRNSEEDAWAPFSLQPLCRPSTDWFDRGAGTSCQDARSPEVIVDSLHATVRICGSVAFSHSFTETDTSPDQYGVVLQNEVLRQVGSRVCCDRFRQPVQSGQCDPRNDIDCDGRPNHMDIQTIPGGYTVPLPDINIYSTALGAAVAPFPDGLNPDDPGFVPNSNGCDCKWQLIKGVLTCGTGGQGHSYVATWKCPTSGREVTTRKDATANTPCP
jgi:hypothetical protein